MERIICCFVIFVGVSWPFLAILAYVTIESLLEERKFWRALKKRGQIAQWQEIRPLLSTGKGMLLVDMWPTGPGCSWWISDPRDEIDPEHLPPSWHDFEAGRDIHGEGNDEISRKRCESIERWTMDRLGNMKVSWKQLAQLNPSIKRDCVLAIGYFDGRLSSRFKKRAKEN